MLILNVIMIFIILLIFLLIGMALIELLKGVYRGDKDCIWIMLILDILLLSISIGMRVDIFEYLERLL